MPRSTFLSKAPFFLGLVGLSYGVLSASWDEDEEGSFLGIEEFQTNVGRLFDGVQRYRLRCEARRKWSRQPNDPTTGLTV